MLGVAALATWPLTGHPTASPVAGVSVVVDAVHLSSMAVWLGGLVMLVAFLLPQANERELGAILPIWSRWAATAVAALVLAGVVQALIEVASFSGLFTSTYGQLILVKVGTRRGGDRRGRVLPEVGPGENGRDRAATGCAAPCWSSWPCWRSCWA